MAIQNSVTVRNARLDTFETTVGTAPLLVVRTGAQPADCATASSGTALVTMTLPSDWMSAASSGSKAKLGTWSGTGANAGTAGHYRIMDSGNTTCHEQGTCGVAVVIATNSTTAANSNVLNFASTTGAVAGQTITGTGVPTGATVLAVTGTTVTMSIASTAGVGSAASITFSYDLAIDNTSVAVSQTVTVSTYTRTAGNA